MNRRLRFFLYPNPEPTCRCTTVTKHFTVTHSLLHLRATLCLGGIGHMKKQISFFKTDWQHTHSHGGTLRKRRRGRKRRPLSCAHPLHVVFKVHRSVLRRGSLREPKSFALMQKIVAQYARRFFVKVEQISVQSNHIHCLIRTSRRSQFHYFFRVVTGQIAQQLQQRGWLRQARVTDTPTATNAAAKVATLKKQKTQKIVLWMHRPFSRVVKGWCAYRIVRNYIQLNEKEALGKIPYRKERLRGLSMADWRELWA